jgi:lipopolysaccharide export system protein LptA
VDRTVSKYNCSLNGNSITQITVNLRRETVTVNRKQKQRISLSLIIHQSHDPRVEIPMEAAYQEIM